jgi:arylsulfatase A-like enzyme
MNTLNKTFLRALTACALPTCAFATTNKNVVLIMADDMGWRDLGCFGSTFYETPNIDQIASEGVKFTNAYSSAPLCSATRAAMLTGWAPARQHLHAVTPSSRTGYENGFEDFSSWTATAVMRSSAPFPATIPKQLGQLPLSSITIAERLKEAGYATGFFGKWHLGPDDDKGPALQGFDVAKADDSLGFPQSYFSPYNNPNLSDGPTGEHLTDRLAAEACTFIRDSVAAEKPFFCYLPTFAVHGPWEAKQSYIDYFNGTRNAADPQNFAVYAAMVRSLDDAMGTIVAELKAQGVYEDTIIIFTSDNGGIRMESPNATDGNKIITSMRPLRGQKATTYEGGLRVPTIVRWPGVAPRVSDEVIVTHDLYPTLLAEAGLSQSPGNPLDGVNLKPYICDQTPTGRDFVTWFFPHYTLIGEPEWNRSNAVIRKGKWKLRHFWDGTDNPMQQWANELYDLDADIGELNNLADQHPEIVTELKGLLMGELTAQNAHIPVANTTNYDEARWFSYWDEQRAPVEYLWSTQQGTPLAWLEDYELVDGVDWHAADWKDAGGVPVWQAYDNGNLPVPFRLTASLSGSQLLLRYPVRTNYQYTLWDSGSLSGWGSISSEIASADGFSELSLPIGGEPRRFYRVEEDGPLAAQPIVLYSTSFGGSSGDPLNGATVDTSGATAAQHAQYGTSAAGIWAADSKFNADGSITTITPVPPAINANGSATLSFTPQNGYVYTMTMTSAFQWDIGDGYHAAGFFMQDGYTGIGNAANGLTVWTLTRPGFTGGSDQVAHYSLVGGIGNQGQADSDTSAPSMLTIVLDTTGGTGDWSAAWYVDGVATPLATAPDLGAVDIESVGISASLNPDGHAFQSFELSVVPEPSAAFLLAAALALPMLRRRRR